MKVQRAAAALLVLVATACASAARAPVPASEVLHAPVVASSMPSEYGIQVRLQGSAVVRDDWVTVAIPTGSVRTYQGKAQAWDLMIRAALVACTGNRKSRVVSESRAARIAPLVGFTRDSSMLDTTRRVFRDTLHLDLGVPHGTNLERAWLAFDVAWPIESVLASYTLNANSPLKSRNAPNKNARADAVCRG